MRNEELQKLNKPYQRPEPSYYLSKNHQTSKNSEYKELEPILQPKT